MKLPKLKVRPIFLQYLLAGSVIILPIALFCRHYLNTHRTYFTVNVFWVRDSNGQMLKKNFSISLKGRKQTCSDQLYWK